MLAGLFISRAAGEKWAADKGWTIAGPNTWETTGEPEPAPSRIAPAHRPPADLPNTSRAGVLYGSPVALRGVGWHGKKPFADSAELLERAVTGGLRQVWIPSAALVGLGLPATFTPKGDGPEYLAGQPHPWLAPALAAGWVASTTPAGLNPWLGLSRTGPEGRHDFIDLVMPSWDDNNPFRHLAAADLLAELEAFAGAVGIRYRRSPGTTGIALMRAAKAGTSRGGRDWPTPEIPTPALEHDGTRLHYIAPGPWPGGGYFHSWDINAMYLAASSSVELGYGPLKESTGEPARPPRTGFQLVEIGPTPAPFTPFITAGAARWLAVEYVRLAVELGARVKILRGIEYAYSARWLEPWYTRIRDARQTLALAGKPAAAAALKLIANQAIGRLDAGWHSPGEDTFRPDWRLSIIARARANAMRHIVKAHNLAGSWPIAVNEDQVVYHSSLAQPGDAAAELGFAVDLTPGHWKYVGSISGRRGAAIARSGKLPAARLNALLAALEGA